MGWPLRKRAYGVGLPCTRWPRLSPLRGKSALRGGASGTLAKLMRVMLLVPALFVVIFFQRKEDQEADVPFAVPWFIVAFAGLCGLRTFGVLTDSVAEVMGFLGSVFLTAGMSALGLRTDLRHIHRLGAAPLVLGAVVWCGLVLFALVLILLLVR